MLHRRHYPPGQIAAVCVVANLRAIAQDVQRILTLQHFLYEVRYDMAHGQLDVATQDFHVTEGALLTDPYAVEWTDDGVGKAILIVGSSGEVFDRKLLKPIGGCRRADLSFLTFL